MKTTLRIRQQIRLLKDIHNAGEYGIPTSKLAKQHKQHLREIEADELAFYVHERWILTDLGRDTLALHERD